MSGFLVCWHRGGAAVPDWLVHAAERRMTRDGTAPPRRLVGEDIAAWHWPGAWAPGAEDALPLERQGWVGSGVLRLDDREALDARLRDAGDGGPTDDATLAWRSLAVWGDRAAEHWIGDYAVAAVAPSRDRLVVSRGITGVRSCFHARADLLELVGDDLGLLVSLLGADGAPVEAAVAEYLRLGQLVTPTLTFHRGVSRVPAAHTLTVARDGMQRLVRHWEFPEPPTRHGVRMDEVTEEFHNVLGRAVADRLRAPRATVLLSGGLDSPALALAARRAAPHVSLRGVTASWARLLPDDEAEFARSAARAAGIPLEVREHAPDEGLGGGAAFVTAEPSPDPEPRLWRTMAAHLASLAPVTLLGEDVDALLMPPPLLWLLRSDGVRHTVRAWRAYRRETGERPWIGARRSLPALERWRDRRLRRAPAWLLPQVADAHPLPDVPPAVPHPSRALAVRSLLQPTWEGNCWRDDPGESGADLVVLLPFMDPRVIAFFFSLPAIPWAQRKYLLRRSLVGALPEALLRRPKTPVRGYYAARVRAWRALGSPATLAAPVEAWVDLAAWRRAIATDADPDAVFRAWRVLELSRWLAQPRRTLP